MASIDDVYQSNSKWLRAADLQGHEVTVRIAGWEMTSFKQKDGSEKKQIALKFEGREKMLGLNKTNANAVAEILRSKDPDQWRGGEVTLVVRVIDYDGKDTEAIRIRPPARRQPPPKREYTEADPPPWDGDDGDIPFSFEAA